MGGIVPSSWSSAVIEYREGTTDLTAGQLRGDFFEGWPSTPGPEMAPCHLQGPRSRSRPSGHQAIAPLLKFTRGDPEHDGVGPGGHSAG
jgi:hypothetical protein